MSSITFFFLSLVMSDYMFNSITMAAEVTTQAV
jgi:hypothetical protein